MRTLDKKPALKKSKGTKKCAYCGKRFKPFWKSVQIQKFCGKKCRESKWVTDNRERLNAAVRRYRKRRYLEDGAWRDKSPKSSALKAWLVELKSEPCADCGNRFDTCCMDFDHRKGTVKSYNIGSMFAHHYSRELIESELAKCDLVCSNCHRVRTRNRRTGSGTGGRG
jgi:hypothetical protein